MKKFLKKIDWELVPLLIGPVVMLISFLALLVGLYLYGGEIAAALMNP